MSTKATLSTTLPRISRSDNILQLSMTCLDELDLYMRRLMETADDYTFYKTEQLRLVSGLIVIMQDQIVNNHQIIEKEGVIAAEFPTSKEQQEQAKVIVEDLRVELDAASLLNLDVTPVSYDTLDSLCQLLIGLRQSIQDQVTEIIQLRSLMYRPKENQTQEPVYHSLMRELFT